MTVEAVTFDCAQTLIAVDWRPAMLAVECAAAAGLSFDDVQAASTYDGLLRKGWSEFQALNLTRDESQTDAFWRRLTEIWVDACNFPKESVDTLLRLAEERLFGNPSSVFALYDDVIPCLNQLKGMGLKLGVVSNWDISLHKALKMYDLYEYFDIVVASMEEGIEKPDPRIFAIALNTLGTGPESTVHVGDNPLDDLQGAKKAGMKGFIIDRANPSEGQLYLSSLLELPLRLQA